jgi:two-component system, cell cycle response regulator DivK
MHVTMAEPPSPLILVVDDYEDSRVMYVEYLRLVGFRVEQAADGKDALEKAMELVPDLILMDLALPVVDGWEAIRRLRADPRTKAVPIIALTGHSQQYAEQTGSSGCDAFLSKPCLPDVLLAEVKRVLAAPAPPG